jgi:hypothetical protein
MPNPLILFSLLLCVMATAVQGEAQGAPMLRQKYLLHYCLIRETVTAVVTMGTAVLLSYVILQSWF